MRISLPLALGLLLGCTNDYDQFNVGGASNQGAGPSGGAPTGAGPAGGAPTGAGPAGGAPMGGAPMGGAPMGGAPTGGAGGDGGNPPVGGMGGAGGMGGNGTGGQGGAGGGGIVNGIECGGGVVCDVENGEFCCIPDGGGATGTCKTSCANNEAPVGCDEPSDCPGQVCCADLSGGTQEVKCEATCGDITVCSVNAECGALMCKDSMLLPDPIKTCQP